MAPLIADQIDKDFDTIARRPSSAAVGWDRDGEDISQRLKKLTMETEAIKEMRKKEIESRNQSLNKVCLPYYSHLEASLLFAIVLRGELTGGSNICIF